jgi:hypothetical protein
MNRSRRCIGLMVAVPALASILAACADTRLAETSASAQASAESTPPRPPAPHQTSYGLSSDGPTTDLYTELFRANARTDQNAPAVAPVSAPASPSPVQQGQPAMTASVAQPQPAAPQAPPATATVYGISSNGTTTDLYTELFKPKRPE